MRNAFDKDSNFVKTFNTNERPSLLKRLQLFVLGGEYFPSSAKDFHKVHQLVQTRHSNFDAERVITLLQYFIVAWMTQLI